MTFTFVDAKSVRTVSEAWDSIPYDPAIGRTGARDAAELSPSDKEWAYLLNLAFATSLRTDEGRSTTFRLAFEREVDGPFSPLTLLHEHHFVETIEATATELTRLAHATSGTPSLIWVRRFRGDAKYVITGIGTGWTPTGERDPDVEAVLAPAAVPIIQCLGAGHLRISKGDVPVAWITGDRLRLPRRTDVFAPIIEERCNPLVSAVMAELRSWTSAHPPVREALPHQAKLRIVRTLTRVLRGIIARGHGGLVLIVPPDDPNLLNRSLRSKYRTLDGSHGGIHASLRFILRLDMLVRFPQILTDSSSGNDRERMAEYFAVLRDMLENRYAEYLGAADEIAAMSGVDGAIVLTQDLQLWGFGAEVLCKEDANEHCWSVSALDSELSADTALPYTHYGTRHRAAFRFCRNVPNALALVVSQDGAAKLVLRRQDKVVFFDNLERDLR